MTNRPEPRGQEGMGFGPRFKVGLETPIVGRFVGEDKKLVFAPPKWYENLVIACMVGGLVMTVSSLIGFGPAFFLDSTWRFWTGLSVLLAGVWALLSNERLVCDLRARQYIRWEGKGPFKNITRGRLEDFDALVLIASQTATPVATGVQYRLVLHWKGSRLPHMVVGQLLVTPPPGAPLNSGAGPLVALGSQYSSSLRVKFFDNSYFHSPGPIKPI